jgi:hypothetical protein
LVSADENASIHQNEVFELIKEVGDMSLAAIIASEGDFRQAVREATTPEDKAAAINRLAIKRLSTTCGRNLDAVYAALFQ